MSGEDILPVLIVGAGPVGLAVAAELGRCGIHCLVAEEQPGTKRHPRAISIGPRTMEYFRRWGIVDDVIDVGVPRDYPIDILYVTRMTGYELTRFVSPSVNDVRKGGAALLEQVPDLRHSPYFRTWVPQPKVEAVMSRFVAGLPSVAMRFNCRFAGYEERDGVVVARLVDTKTNEEATVGARYLIGCDGARSAVRRAAGIRLAGKGALGQAWGVHFRAPTLLDLRPVGPGVMYWPLAPGCECVIYTLNGRDEWWMNKYFRPGEPFRDIDPVAEIVAAVGADLPVEVLSCQSYKAQQLVAEHFRAGPVFLAGDAAHLFVPTGGLGLNTGMDDAVNLAWKLAAAIEGWAGDALLDSFEAERLPIGRRNTLQAAENYERTRAQFAAPPEIENDDAAGRTLRAELGAALYRAKKPHHSITGAQLGSAYDASPVCISDGTPAPPDDVLSYVATARPGHRAPHAWLEEDRSVIDLFDRRFTLLAFEGAESEAAPLSRAAEAAGVPMEVIAVEDACIARLYERRLVLVRPDGHVAWRGDAPPGDSRAVIDTIRGA